MNRLHTGGVECKERDSVPDKGPGSFFYYEQLAKQTDDMNRFERLRQCAEKLRRARKR